MNRIPQSIKRVVRSRIYRLIKAVLSFAILAALVAAIAA